MDWEGLWTLLLSAGLFLFAALTVIVAISGFFNVRWMFRMLDRQHAERPDGQAAGDPALTDGGDAGDPDEPDDL